MTQTLTLRDWLVILDLDGPLDDLLAGRSYPGEFRSAIDAARGVYPGVMGDYVRVLDSVADVVEDVEGAIDELEAEAARTSVARTSAAISSA